MSRIAKLISFTFLFLFLTHKELLAQPGWVDLSRYFGYTILDEKGEEITFKNNRKYVIRIDGKEYSDKTIPQEQFNPIQPYVDHFQDRISVNDLTLSRPMTEANLEIEIIHGKDTLFLFNGPNLKRTFTFIPGHYYIPYGLEGLMSNLPKVSGQVQIKNGDQRHFIIPKTLYDSIKTLSPYQKLAQKKADQLVKHHFINGFLEVQHQILPTSLSPSIHPFKGPYCEGPFYSTSDSNLVVGIVTYRLDTFNLSAWQGVLSILNKSKNSITHWMPMEKSHQFTTLKIYRDTFNSIFYQSTIIRDVPCTFTRYYNCPNHRNFYRSLNGQSWELDTALTELYEEINFREFEFIDERHAIAFNRYDDKAGKYAYQRGTYYLIKNMEIIDSMQTPKGVHYNSNYQGYRYKRLEDRIELGVWGLDARTSYGSTYHLPTLIKNGDSWEFKIEELIHKINSGLKEDKNNYRVFQNFYFMNEREMVFKNGAGRLTINANIADNTNSWRHGDIRVIEKGNQIYLIGQQYTLISFDSGSQWVIYPQPLNPRKNYAYLTIDESDNLSYFDFGHSDEQPMNKTFITLLNSKNRIR